MDLTIRAAGEDDHEGVHAILTSPHVVRGSMRVPHSHLGVTRERLAPRAGVHQLVAVADGQIAGFGELVVHDDARARHGGEINMVAVHADWARRGIGRRLMEELITLAFDWLNLQRLGLIVFDGNDHAVRLYEQLGFEHEGTLRRLGYGDGRWMDALAMARLRELP